MNQFENDTLTILNYQGSKKNLLEFIYNNTVEYIDENKAFFDIFCGTTSVGYAMKRYYTIYANDSELYASTIAKSLINNTRLHLLNKNLDRFYFYYGKNYKFLEGKYNYFLREEELSIKMQDYSKLTKLYMEYPCIWSNVSFDYYKDKIKSIEDLQKYKDEIPYMLFTTYYANTYFGVKQSIEIDSIRYAIDKIDNYELKNIMLSSLYFAMKQCVFSKDGHMAQPLDICKNKHKVCKIRQKSIYLSFIKKVKEYDSNKFVVTDKNNKVFNLEFSKILKLDTVKENVGFIYADPPYTDMQYSRYYHLLNTVTKYDYDKLSYYRGKLSKGLYREDRYQSPLSQKSKAKQETEKLFDYCKQNKINLGFSFAYPRNPEKQPNNRYTMSINEIIKIAETTFGSKNIKICTQEYKHSNNRNSTPKQVLEYLIVCKN